MLIFTSGIISYIDGFVKPDRGVFIKNEIKKQRNLLTSGEHSDIITTLRGVAQFGRALGSGPRGRVFESPHSDHKKGLSQSVKTHSDSPAF